jgi:hypothetical protein
MFSDFFCYINNTKFHQNPLSGSGDKTCGRTEKPSIYALRTHIKVKTKERDYLRSRRRRLKDNIKMYLKEKESEGWPRLGSSGGILFNQYRNSGFRKGGCLRQLRYY